MKGPIQVQVAVASLGPIGGAGEEIIRYHSCLSAWLCISFWGVSDPVRNTRFISGITEHFS